MPAAALQRESLEAPPAHVVNASLRVVSISCHARVVEGGEVFVMAIGPSIRRSSGQIGKGYDGRRSQASLAV